MAAAVIAVVTFVVAYILIATERVPKMVTALAGECGVKQSAESAVALHLRRRLKNSARRR